MREEFAFIAGDAHPALAHAVAQHCGVVLTPAIVQAFADGETSVRIDSDLCGRRVCIIQPTSAPTNAHLMSLALVADAARGAGAHEVTAAVPYFGYARQDVRRTPGEPLSARFAAKLLAAAGIDRIVVLELHSPALQSAFDMALIDLRADTAMLPAVAAWQLDHPVVVSPDAGGLKRAQRYAAALNGPLAAIAKSRTSPDAAVARQVMGDVRNRVCLIVDDMASTGNTIASAAAALLDAGAREVHALFIHAVMAPGALERIHGAGVGRILTTDSVPGTASGRVEVVSIAPLLADALQRWTGKGKRAQ